MKTQYKVSFSDDEWAAIVVKAVRLMVDAPASQHTPSNMIRIAVGLSPIFYGGDRKSAGIKRGKKRKQGTKKA